MKKRLRKKYSKLPICKFCQLWRVKLANMPSLQGEARRLNLIKKGKYDLSDVDELTVVLEYTSWEFEETPPCGNYNSSDLSK